MVFAERVFLWWTWHCHMLAPAAPDTGAQARTPSSKSHAHRDVWWTIRDAATVDQKKFLLKEENSLVLHVLITLNLDLSRCLWKFTLQLAVSASSVVRTQILYDPVAIYTWCYLYMERSYIEIHTSVSIPLPPLVTRKCSLFFFLVLLTLLFIAYNHFFIIFFSIQFLLHGRQAFYRLIYFLPIYTCVSTNIAILCHLIIHAA